MKRTGSIGSAVPPALTRILRPSRSWPRVSGARGGRRAASATRIGRPTTAACAAATMRAVSASRPRPSAPEASGPSSGSTMAYP